MEFHIRGFCTIRSYGAIKLEGIAGHRLFFGNPMPKDPQTDQYDFGRLFVQYQPRIYGYIRSLVADRSDAEDMLQETASVLWQKFDEFTPGTNFLA